jgi:D-3-phosphoglycerate dehydrogenase
VYADGLPRVTHLDGFAMDMVARGPMVVLTNVDEPGRIGLVGQLFGAANVNIAEMAIGRREGERSEQGVAMMVIRLDAPPPAELIEALRAAHGIRRVGAVVLAGVSGGG